MGQPSSPLVNKLGTNLYWSTMWNDKLNYTKKLKEDIFINMFFFLIFKKITTQTPILKINYFQNLLKNSNKFYKINTKFYFLKNLKNKISFFKKNKAAYMGKIWILRFNTWLILLTSYYVPQFTLKVLINKNKNIFTKKKFQSVYKSIKLIKLYNNYFIKYNNKKFY